MPGEVVERTESSLKNILYYLKYGFVLFLRRFYRHLGLIVARHPFKFILFTLLASVISVGLFRARLYAQIKSGYTPLDALSHFEDQVYQQFFRKTGSEPHESLVMITGKNDRSLLEPETFEAAMNISDYILKEFSVTGPDGMSYRLEDLCENLCDINLPVYLVQDALKSSKPNTYIKYPVSSYLGHEVDLSFNFFGVKNRPDSQGQYNQLSEVSLIMLYLFPQAHNETVNQIVLKWEMALFHYIYDNFTDPYVNVAVIGDRMIVSELNRGGMTVGYYLIMGFIIMCAFVLSAYVSGALYYGELSGSTLIISWAAVMAPLLACAATFGIVCLLNVALYPILLIAPFLILAIGVDDAFLMAHAWHRLSELHTGTKFHVEDRLGLVLQDVGPSITITSITNCLAFSIGMTTSTPAIQVFCMVTAIAMAVSFVFELTFFGSFLSLAGRMEKSPSVKPKIASKLRPKIHKLVNKAIERYCRLLADRLTCVLVLLFTIALWVFAILGTSKIKTVVSIRKVLPYDTPLFTADDLIQKHIWKTYYPVMVFVNDAHDINEHNRYKAFQKMVHEFETAPFAIGNSSTRLWLRDYVEFDAISSIWDFLMPEEENDNVFSLDSLPTFLSIKPHWTQFIHWSQDTTLSSPVVKSFVFSTGYQNATNWDIRTAIVLRWRKIAEKYPQFNVTVYGQNNFIIDAIINLRSVTKQSIILTFICMAAVCVLFIPSLCGVICASWAIASTSLSVFGSLSWWGLDLDPVTMGAILMSIGFSVDFTAHTSYHYQKTIIDGDRSMSKIDRLVITMESICWPMIQAGFSTLICVLPLAFHGDYAPGVFIKTIYLLVTWGLIHGLVILPTILTALPDCFVTATTAKKSEKKSLHIQYKNGDVAVNGLENQPLQNS